MATYEYRALNQEGKNCKGVLKADTSQQAADLLKQQGLIPVKIQVSGGKKKAKGSGSARASRHGASKSDIPVVLRQLANLIAAGFQLAEALKLLANNSRKPAVRQALTGMRSDLLEGKNFSQCLENVWGFNDKTIVASVAAGERSGSLAEILEALADETESQERIRRQIKGALAYPLLLLTACILVIAALAIFIIPRFVTVFESQERQLPALTQTVINISAFIGSYWYIILSGFIALVIAWRIVSKIPSIRLMIDQQLLRLPLIGNLRFELNATKFCRSLGTLYKAGVPVIEALKIAVEVLDLSLLRKRALLASEDIKEGTSINQAFDKQQLLPPVSIAMISAGENSGSLALMLQRDAHNREIDLRVRINFLLRLLEPLIILFMAAMVLVVALSVLLPILDLNKLS